MGLVATGGSLQPVAQWLRGKLYCHSCADMGTFGEAFMCDIRGCRQLLLLDCAARGSPTWMGCWARRSTRKSCPHSSLVNHTQVLERLNSKDRTPGACRSAISPSKRCYTCCCWSTEHQASTHHKPTEAGSCDLETPSSAACNSCRPGAHRTSVGSPQMA